MHLTQSPQPHPPGAHSSIERILRLARRLHRAALSNSLCTALPVLRRMLAAGVADGPLTELFRRRKTLQRKQLLRMLARENGFPSWEVFRPALARMPVDALGGLDLAEEGTAVLHLWFASEVSAVAFASENGGRAVRVGTQAVVLPH